MSPSSHAFLHQLRREQEREDRAFAWHLWFAWRPITLPDGTTAWLKRVWRSKLGVRWGTWYRYRPREFREA